MRPANSNAPRTAKLTLLLIACLGLAHAATYLQPFEDAYISYRYAQNFADGLGLVWNSGERVEGFTSPSWVILLAAVARVGLPTPDLAPLLSLALGLVSVLILARRVVHWTSQHWVGVACAALVVARGNWAYWSATGMETTLFLVLLVAGAATAIEPGRKAAVLAGLLLGAASLTRPEGIGYAVAALLVRMLSRDGRRDGWVLALVWLGVLIPFLVWRHHYFGWWLPNTYYAKMGPTSERFWPGIKQLEQYLTLHLGWLQIPAAIVVWRRRSAPPFVRLAVAVILASWANLVLVGGDSFAFQRFLLPADLFSAPLIVEAVRLSASSRIPAQRHAGFAIAATGVGCAVLMLGAYLPTRTLLGDGGPSSHARVAGVASINDDYLLVGRWLREQFPKTTLVALNAAGIVPFESRLPSIDMLGLTDSQIAHRQMRVWEGALGHQKHDVDYVLSRQPDLILPGLPTLMRTEEPPSPRKVAAWLERYGQFIPGDRELLAHEGLRAEYSLRAVRIADTGYLILFVRLPTTDAESARHP